MTKVIIVLRHAQSVGKQSGGQDYDRPLDPLGTVCARTLGKKLPQHNFNLDLILSSSATRARQTVELINETVRLPEEKIHYKRELYEALMAHWLDHIRMLPNDVHQVMLVGHNPWLSMLASSFAGKLFDLAPCQLVAFEFKSDGWNEIDHNGREIVNIK